VKLEAARRIWVARQGLGAPPAETDPASVVERTGLVRTLGGTDVYFAVLARTASLRPATLESAVAKGKLQVLPAVRGCIYLVPSTKAPLLIQFAADRALPRLEKEIAKAGSSVAELEELGSEIRKALRKAPLGTNDIKKALPAGSVRSLGDAGKKIGLSSPLPAALRVLEFQGWIRRTLDGGRLDREQYLWEGLDRSLFAKAKVPKDSAGRLVEVARVFFDTASPARVDDFATWAGVGKREAQAAVDALGLVPVEIDDLGKAFAYDEDEDPGKGSGVAFLPFEDNALVLHGDTIAPMIASDRGRSLEVRLWGMSGTAPLGEARHVQARTILLGDAIVGLWDFDPDAGEVVWGTFEKPSAAIRKRLDAEAARVTSFVADGLGHGRAYTLDTDELVRMRAAQVNTLR
jgi:hypothetical protein